MKRFLISFSKSSTMLLVIVCAMFIDCAFAQTKEFRKLCKKYVLNCPIDVTPTSSWSDRVIVQQLLRDYLKSKKKWINNVSFDGLKITVSGVVKAAPDDQRSNQDIEQDCRNQILQLLQAGFVQSKNVIIDIKVVRTPDDLNMEQAHSRVISVDELNKKYLTNDLNIEFDMVWFAIINAVNATEGFEIDSKSEVRASEYGKISTIRKIIQENGFVNRYFLTVEMKPLLAGTLSRKAVQIETLLKVQRKRASASNNDWTEISIGDHIDALGSLVLGFDSSMPVFNSIKEALRK
jgi:hypothetical protein